MHFTQFIMHKYMHTVGCAVCTMRDSEGFTRPCEIKSTEINSTDKQMHTYISMYSRDTGSHLQEHQACPWGDVCMCVTSPTRGKKKKTSYDGKTKNNRRPREVLILTFPASSSSWRPKVHRLQVHKHKALLFLSRNVKIPLECDLMLLKREASLSPPEWFHICITSPTSSWQENSRA